MKPFFSKLTNLTTKQLLVIIAILLAVIAFPVIINAFDYVSRTTAKLIISNKESYCAREFPSHTVKALTPNEFDAFVAKKVATGAFTSYLELYEYDGMTETQVVRRIFGTRLRDSRIFPAMYYDNSGNRCSQGSSHGATLYVADIPWYYF